jgi:DNA polymerase III epsilon subunit-like protein
MSGLKYYVIDTETTGLKAGFNEMTEIGIIRCVDRVQLWRQIKCDYPERANFDALAITKKTLADLELGRLKHDVVEECNKFFDEDGCTPAHRCIVAHNAAFDRRFLHAMWASCGQEFPANLWLDTIALTKSYAKKIGLVKPKVNLHAACDIVGIKKLSEAHNAKVDSRNTYLLHRDLIDVKRVDHLPHIKTEAHIVHAPDPSSIDSDDGLDLSLLDE